MKYREKNIWSKVDPEFRKKLYFGQVLRERPTVYKVTRDEKILIVPKETIGYVIGKKGCFIKDISNKFKTKIIINEKNELIVYSSNYRTKQKVRNEIVKRIKSFEGNKEPIRYITIKKIFDAIV